LSIDSSSRLRSPSRYLPGSLESHRVLLFIELSSVTGSGVCFGVFEVSRSVSCRNASGVLLRTLHIGSGGSDEFSDPFGIRANWLLLFCSVCRLRALARCFVDGLEPEVCTVRFRASASTSREWLGVGVWLGRSASYWACFFKAWASFFIDLA